MVRRDARLRGEEGSQTVQAAVAVPVIIVVLCVACQVAYMAVSESVLSSQIHKASTAIDVSRISARDADGELKRQIASYSDMIDADRLAVENTSVTYPPASVERADVEGGGVSSMEKRVQTAVVTADVAYEIPSMISAFGFDGITVTRHIESVQTVDANVEVS